MAVRVEQKRARSISPVSQETVQKAEPLTLAGGQRGLSIIRSSEDIKALAATRQVLEEQKASALEFSRTVVAKARIRAQLVREDGRPRSTPRASQVIKSAKNQAQKSRQRVQQIDRQLDTIKQRERTLRGAAARNISVEDQARAESLIRQEQKKEISRGKLRAVELEKRQFEKEQGRLTDSELYDHNVRDKAASYTADFQDESGNLYKIENISVNPEGVATGPDRNMTPLNPEQFVEGSEKNYTPVPFRAIPFENYTPETEGGYSTNEGVVVLTRQPQPSALALPTFQEQFQSDLRKSQELERKAQNSFVPHKEGILFDLTTDSLRNKGRDYTTEQAELTLSAPLRYGGLALEKLSRSGTDDRSRATRTHFEGVVPAAMENIGREARLNPKRTVATLLVTRGAGQIVGKVAGVGLGVAKKTYGVTTAINIEKAGNIGLGAALGAEFVVDPVGTLSQAPAIVSGVTGFQKGFVSTSPKFSRGQRNQASVTLRTRDFFFDEQFVAVRGKGRAIETRRELVLKERFAVPLESGGQLPQFFSGNRAGKVGGKSARQRAGRTSKTQQRTRKQTRRISIDKGILTEKVRTKGLKEEFVKERRLKLRITEQGPERTFIDIGTRTDVPSLKRTGTPTKKTGIKPTPRPGQARTNQPLNLKKNEIVIFSKTQSKIKPIPQSKGKGEPLIQIIKPGGITDQSPNALKTLKKTIKVTQATNKDFSILGGEAKGKPDFPTIVTGKFGKKSTVSKDPRGLFFEEPVRTSGKEQERFFPGSPEARRAATRERLFRIREERGTIRSAEDSRLRPDREIAGLGPREALGLGERGLNVFGERSLSRRGFDTGTRGDVRSISRIDVAQARDNRRIFGFGTDSDVSLAQRQFSRLDSSTGQKQVVDTVSDFDTLTVSAFDSLPIGKGKGKTIKDEGERPKTSNPFFPKIPDTPGRPPDRGNPRDPPPITRDPPPVGLPGFTFFPSRGRGGGGGGVTSKSAVSRTFLETELGIGGSFRASPGEFGFSGFELVRSTNKKKKVAKAKRRKK